MPVVRQRYNEGAILSLCRPNQLLWLKEMLKSRGVFDLAVAVKKTDVSCEP
jgi:hypothetical protein